MDSGSEILLNLQNYKNLTNTELVGGLIELSKRAKNVNYDWNSHPIVSLCLQSLKKKQPRLCAKHIAQIQLILHGLRIQDQEFWSENAKHVLRMLHLYKARDFAQFLDLFDAEILDVQGEPLIIQKAEDVFFERLAGLLPMFVKEMTNAQIVRTLEVCVARNLGSQRLYEHYLIDMIEKHVLTYNVSLYSRMVRALAQKGFAEDYVFWEKYVFRFVFELPRGQGERRFTAQEAKQLWDSFVFLKLKCPSIDIKEVLIQLEKFMENQEEQPVQIEETQ